MKLLNKLNQKNILLVWILVVVIGIVFYLIRKRERFFPVISPLLILKSKQEQLTKENAEQKQQLKINDTIIKKKIARINKQKQRYYIKKKNARINKKNQKNTERLV